MVCYSKAASIVYHYFLYRFWSWSAKVGKDTNQGQRRYKHAGNCDETSLLTCMHGPALLTEVALEVDQLKKQWQELSTVHLAKVSYFLE